MPKSRDSIGRRRFIKAVPAAVAATVTLPKIVEGQRGGGAPPRFGKDALKCAEQLDGVAFTDAEDEMAAASVSRNLDSYEELRKLTVPLDTEPAITFRPYLPGKQPTGKSSRGAKIAIAKAPAVPVTPGSLEDLAFQPVTVLASLIESKRVTSTDLTKMYLGRLKRYGDRLHCVVTLTEELALAQAATADREIKAGKYRGPLHGIPFGVKDLFDTKGIRTTWGAKP
jgi:Amidase